MEVTLSKNFASIIARGTSTVTQPDAETDHVLQVFPQCLSNGSTFQYQINKKIYKYIFKIYSFTKLERPN